MGGEQAGADRRLTGGLPAASPTIAVMEPRAAPRRDLVLAVVAVVALARLADPPLVWLVAVLLVAAVLVGSLQVLGESDANLESTGVPIEALLTPAVAAFAALGAIRLVPLGLGLVPALVLVWFLVDRTLATEARIAAQVHGATPEDRTSLLVQAVIVAFVAFCGTAALVPGGLPEPGLAGAPPDTLSEGNLLLLASVDALVAGLLGYRVSALRVTHLRDALWSATTYASAIAIAAAALRAMDIPRLVGPALLTLVFFLWDAFHGAQPSRRRDPRWLWQTVVLLALGIIVIGWNLRLRG
jgi:hypothetical protein